MNDTTCAVGKQAYCPTKEQDNCNNIKEIAHFAFFEFIGIENGFVGACGIQNPIAELTAIPHARPISFFRS